MKRLQEMIKAVAQGLVKVKAKKPRLKRSRQETDRKQRTYSAVPQNLKGHTVQGTKKVQGSGRV